MLHIQVKSERGPRVLAELIASTQSETPVDSRVAVEAKLLRDHQEHEARMRPSWETLDTVNFGKLDDENDWSDL
jgi:hypothetical protein